MTTHGLPLESSFPSRLPFLNTLRVRQRPRRRFSILRSVGRWSSRVSSTNMASIGPATTVRFRSWRKSRSRIPATLSGTHSAPGGLGRSCSDHEHIPGFIKSMLEDYKQVRIRLHELYLCTYFAPRAVSSPCGRILLR